MKWTIQTRIEPLVREADPSSMVIGSLSRIYTNRDVECIMLTRPLPEFHIEYDVWKLAELAFAFAVLATRKTEVKYSTIGKKGRKTTKNVLQSSISFNTGGREGSKKRGGGGGGGGGGFTSALSPLQ